MIEYDPPETDKGRDKGRDVGAHPDGALTFESVLTAPEGSRLAVAVSRLAVSIASIATEWQEHNRLVREGRKPETWHALRDAMGQGLAQATQAMKAIIEGNGPTMYLVCAECGAELYIDALRPLGETLCLGWAVGGIFDGAPMHARELVSRDGARLALFDGRCPSCRGQELDS